MDKYVNTSGFDMNTFDAERVAARESQERTEKIANDPNFRAANDLKDIERQNNIDNYFREQRRVEENRIVDENYRRFKQEQERKDAQKRAKVEFEQQQAREQHLQKYLEKNKATKAAYERYKQHSVFYRMFHKNIYKMSSNKRDKMSVEDINALYGGRSK